MWCPKFGMFERIEKCIEDHRSICHRFYLEVHRQLISKNEKIHIARIYLMNWVKTDMNFVEFLSESARAACPDLPSGEFPNWVKTDMNYVESLSESVCAAGPDLPSGEFPICFRPITVCILY